MWEVRDPTANHFGSCHSDERIMTTGPTTAPAMSIFKGEPCAPCGGGWIKQPEAGQKRRTITIPVRTHNQRSLMVVFLSGRSRHHTLNLCTHHPHTILQSSTPHQGDATSRADGTAVEVRDGIRNPGLCCSSTQDLCRSVATNDRLLLPFQP